MKKTISIILAVLMLCGVMSACSSGNDNSENKKLSIVTTIFPEYDWVREILGERADKAEVTMLLDNGVDLHSYQPTADDMIKISSCDMFIYVGGESDGWTRDALADPKNSDRTVINLLDVLGDAVKSEELIDGMQEDEHEQEEHEEGYDEHVWLSLKNAKIFCNEIAEKLSVLDAENKELYNDNLTAYKAKLDELDAGFAKTVGDADKKTVLFGDRFPFRYLIDDYGLEYFAAFVGCSAETEASFETIAFLSGKVDELGLKTVITIEGSNRKIAETIIANTADKNQTILSLDSMQSVTSNDVDAGETYLSIMNKNLDVIGQALK